MVAYQAETDLVRRCAPHYRRADDQARTLVQSMLANAGDIAVTGNELRVTFAPDRRARRAVHRNRRPRAARYAVAAPPPPHTSVSVNVWIIVCCCARTDLWKFRGYLR
jgi:hypothetical protein